jgi:hypothetical protein
MKYLLALLLLLPGALPASAQQAQPIDWRARTLADVEAVDRAVREVHPGLVDPLHPELARDWAEAARIARLRADEVGSRAGWAGTLRILVNSLRDSHASILISAQQPAPPVWWTGYAVEHIAGRYYLRPVDAPGAPAGELRLLRCGDRPIDAVAASQLDLHATNWWVAANRSIAAPRLLVDNGNPFVRRIDRCTVLIDGQREQAIDFVWREGEARAVSAALRPWQRRRAGAQRFALDWQADGSAWISVSSFADSAGNAQVRTAMSRERARLLRAPYVVFDVRGNGGGNSQLGDMLGEALWGPGTLRPAPPPSRPKRWRASQRLVAALRSMRGQGDPNPERDRCVDAVLPVIEGAVARGEALVDDPSNATAAQAAQRRRTRPARTGPVFVLTDGGCASACIMFVSEVRRMGARQIGDPTDRNTIYAEQWVAEMLPSGEAQLLLPSAWFGWPDSELGGGPPDVQWEGRATDEAGLRAFIAARARTPRRR